jgi:hypothetical protein
MNTPTLDATTATALRARLLAMARSQDELAADLAAATPYWQPQPLSVQGHHAAAYALRAEADLLLAAS